MRLGPSLATSLTGLRVLDASRVLAGPFAGQVLADLGADVIKVEAPGAGDETRGWGPPFAGEAADGMSAYFLSANRGKRSVTLDLKKPEGRALFGRLAAASDVVLSNFRGDSAKTLGVTAEALHALNPRLVVCEITGYGRVGAWAAKPGYDFVVQGLSGLMAATGPAEGPPSKAGVALADVTTGLYAAVAVLAALRGRGETGQGYAVEVALVDCAVAAMVNLAQSFLTSGKTPKRQGNAHLQIVPYQLFETADGWLVLAVGNDHQWRSFCRVAASLGGAEGGRGGAAPAKEPLSDPRFATNADRVRRRDELVPQVASLVRRHPTAAWQSALDAAGVPCGPVWDFAQLFSSDLAADRRFKVTARRADGTPVDLLRSPLAGPDEAVAVQAPPALGEHTAAVLQEVLGLSAAEIARLAAEGVT